MQPPARSRYADGPCQLPPGAGTRSHDAVVPPTVGAQHNIGGGTALALLPSHIQSFGISSDQYLKLEATVDGEIVLTNSKHVLYDMIEQCDLKVLPPVGLALWGVVRPEGEEIR